MGDVKTAVSALLRPLLFPHLTDRDGTRRMHTRAALLDWMRLVVLLALLGVGLVRVLGGRL